MTESVTVVNVIGIDRHPRAERLGHRWSELAAKAAIANPPPARPCAASCREFFDLLRGTDADDSNAAPYRLQTARTSHCLLAWPSPYLPGSTAAIPSGRSRAVGG